MHLIRADRFEPPFDPAPLDNAESEETTAGRVLMTHLLFRSEDDEAVG